MEMVCGGVHSSGIYDDSLKRKALLRGKALKGWMSALSIVTNDLQPMCCGGGVLLSSMVEKSLQHHLVEEYKLYAESVGS